ncbi:uncharacterized protein BDV14DRAFT_177940 [Aspergillus stella-maris]|uniref:uncharacterized protein n=1 Tax=Aspergillus stella-maris TaxID=1810926 RepID=UPI003CCD1BAE
MTTNPSVIFYQGLRCTKVPRQPRATDSLTSSIEEIIPSTSTNAPAAVETSTGPTDGSSADRTSSEDTTITTSTPAAGNLETQSAAESHSSGVDVGIYNTSTEHSFTHTTFNTGSTTTSEPTATSPGFISSAPDDGSGGPPYAMIFGILFGLLAFIVLIALIIFFLLRRRKRQLVEESQDDRSSANSRTGLRQDFRSQSYLSDASPAPSTLLPEVPQMRLSDNQTPYQTPARNSDPFADTLETQPGPKSFIVPIITQRCPTYPEKETQYYTQPAASHNPNRDSIHSATSLGSTLVLPGRSSFGSEYQGLSPTYPKSPSSGSSFPGVFPQPADTSLRSGSFDLGNSQSGTAVSRRSSGVMPGGLL